MRYIKGYGNRYQATRGGEIISSKSGKPLKPSISNSGYYCIKLSDGVSTHNHNIHRLIATTFLIPVKGKNQVNHINGIKTDNRIENLEWNTPQENPKHAYSTGLRTASPQLGSKHGESKLKENDINEIKAQHAQGRSLSALAAQYLVTKPTIWKVCSGRSWRHVV